MTSSELSADRWLRQSQSVLDDSAVSALDVLGCVDAGVECRRALETTGSSSQPREQLVRRIAHLQYLALARLASSMEGASPECAATRIGASELLDQWLRRDELYATTLLNHPNEADGFGMFLCDAFRADLQWYAMIAAHIEREPEPDRAYAIKSHLEHLSRTIADLPPSNDEEAVRRQSLLQQVDELQKEYLDDRISDEIEYPIDGAAPRNLWVRRFQLSRLHADRMALGGAPRRPSNRAVAGSATGQGNPPSRALLTRRLEDRQDELADVAEERLLALPDSERDTACRELSLIAREESNDILALSEDQPLPLAVERLRIAASDFRRFASTSRRVRRAHSSNDNRRGCESLARTSRRLLRRTRNELQEKKLSLRMERLFGRGAVAWMENTILALILVLTVFIVLELVLDARDWLTPGLRAFFAWADLLICGCFLSEFFLKLSLVEGRLRYFTRHFFIDFLASLPFGFLSYNLGRFEIVGEEAGLLRLLRFVRLPQLARYIRVAQPLIRVGRLVFFLLRTTDRLVRKHAAVFNRNILLFQPKAIGFEEHGYRMRMARLREQFTLRAREMETALTATARVERAKLSLAELRARYECLPTTAVPEPMSRSAYGREIPADEVVRELIEMTPERLVQRMGPAFPDAVARYVRYFDLPLVRRLPMVRTLVAARGRGSGEVAALAANQLGYILQGVLNAGYYLADLQGTISGPIFLDRLGTVMVTATASNAKKLLVMGTTFLFLFAFVKWLGVFWLAESFTKIQSVFGTPLLVLGGVCLVLMLFGRWLKSLANQASEAGERLVEAQFAAQTKSFKSRYMASDLRFLADRVITPELVLRSCDDSDLGDNKPLGVSAEALLEKTVRTMLPAGLFGEVERFDAVPLSDELFFLRTVALLHLDYLDSGLFRPTDTKTTTQLLGNLALANLRRSNIADLLNGRRLRALDLSRSSGSLFGGPYLWFNYVTRIITEETAKRIIDFNRNAVPLSRLACASSETRDRYRTWVSRRLGIPPSSVPLPQGVGDYGNQPAVAGDGANLVAQPALETVDFTTMDFLLQDARRDSEIAEKYGALVLKMVKNDRKRGLRRAFRSFPLHRFSASERTFNPFTMYLDYCSGGRIVLLPFRILWWEIKGVGLFLRQIWRTVQELLHPPPMQQDPPVDDSFAVALRKIHRMRKPGFLALLWLRARLDVEYLGLCIPGVTLTTGAGSMIEDDLNFIGSSRRDRVTAQQILAVQRRRIAAMAPLLTSLGFQVQQLPVFLAANYPHLTHRSAEVMRALTMAWVTDYEGLASLATSLSALVRFIEHAAAASPDNWSIPEGLPATVRRQVGQKRLRARSARPALRGVLGRLGFASLDEAKTRQVLHLLRRHWPLVRGWIGTIQSLPPGPELKEILSARLREVILRTDLWSDQIVVLRTLQSLTVLDVYHYCRMLWDLGGYGDRDGEEFPARLPMSSEAFDWSTRVATVAGA